MPFGHDHRGSCVTRGAPMIVANPPTPDSRKAPEHHFLMGIRAKA